ncbi:recombination-associated protein RdgC [Luteibacter mycovicinus]|uniref:recombination-associated protein RdgC n=1 Tax=Luteibacter mycovicinus TaxID=1500890 RepID=UPI0005694E65|nr:recombination-associated protein RdgC [Luteibacter sp. 9143a]
MFPRNLTAFRFGTPPRPHVRDILEALADYRVREPGPMEFAATGFVSPYGRTDDRLGICHENVLGFVYQVRARDLKASALNEEIAKRVEKISQEEGRKVGGRERRSIRDDVLNELLPRAMVTVSNTAGWIDLDNGWLVVDTRTRQRAEDVLTELRSALGSFPAVRLAPEESPRRLMTHWLSTLELPQGITLGDEAELRDPATATGALVRVRRQNLDTDEIREHLRGGKQCFAVGVTVDDRLSLVLSEDLSMRSVRATDVVLDQAITEHESVDAEIDSRFALAVLEVRALFDRLAVLFRIPRPEVV